MRTLHIIREGERFRAEIRTGYDPSPVSATADTAMEAIGRLVWKHPEACGLTLSTGAKENLGESPEAR